MKYAQIKNGAVVAYPVTADEMRKAYSNTSLPEVIPEWLAKNLGFHPVFADEKPADNPDTIWEMEAAPQQRGSDWFVGWIGRDRTLAEQEEYRQSKSDQVKAEAYRRIITICPEWQQRNLTAQAAQLAKKGEANWTPEEAAAWAAGETLWGQIAAIRAASDVIEAMDPIPANFYDLPDWP